jgi:serine/threonine protein phosphatase PrpC
VAAVLLAARAPDAAARRVVEEALAAGSDDNITALVLAVDAVESLDTVTEEYRIFGG